MMALMEHTAIFWTTGEGQINDFCQLFGNESYCSFFLGGGGEVPLPELGNYRAQEARCEILVLEIHAMYLIAFVRVLCQQQGRLID